MGILSDKRIALAWLVLVGITLLSWWVGARHGPGPLRSDPAVGMIAIAITLAKVRVIVREFMDVRSAPVVLKRVTDGWLAAFGLAMVAAYFV